MNKPLAPAGPYRAAFGAIHHDSGPGYVFTVDPPHMAPEVAEALNAQLALGEVLEALKGIVRLSEMGFEESLRQPEETGNFAAFERAKAAIANVEGRR